MRHPFPIDRLMLDAMTMLFCLFAALFAKSGLQKAAEEAAKQPIAGDITVTAEWDRGVDVDVDLWVKGPTDEFPVGFNHTSDRQSSYLHDDQGMNSEGSMGRDLTDLNYEIIGVRGLVPGRYVVNLHLFDSKEHPKTHVVVTASRRYDENGGTSRIFSKELDLTENKSEVTAGSFTIGSDGRVVEGSLSEVYIPMVTGLTVQEPTQ